MIARINGDDGEGGLVIDTAVRTGATKGRRLVCQRAEKAARIQGAQRRLGAWVCPPSVHFILVAVFSSPLLLSSVFQAPWDKILQSTDGIAASHQLLAQRIEKDVEQSLRTFQNKKEMQSIHTISTNLQTMARELEDAQEKSDKLTKKGGKANVQKVDQATSKLESATQQWESQAPFIFESLQALDELRINHLRDVLTQLETHEVDQATRTQAAAEDAVNFMLEINTSAEIQNFAHKVTAGKPKVERKSGPGPGTMSRQSTSAGPSPLAPPSGSVHDDDVSEHSKDGPQGKLQ